MGISAPSTPRCLSVLRTGKTRRHVCVPVATSARTLTPAGRAQPGDTRPPSRPLQEEPGQNCLPLKPFLMRPSIDLGDGSLRRVGKGHCWHTCDTTRSQGTHRGLRPQGSWGGQTPGRPGGTAIPHRPSPFPDSGSACSSSTGQHQSQVPPRAFVMVAFKQRNKNAVTLGFRGARQRAVAMGTAHRALDARLLPGTTMVLLPPPPTHKLLPHPLLDPRDKEEKPQHVSSLKRDTGGWWAKGDKEINSLGATGLHAATPGARHPHSGAPLPGDGPPDQPCPHTQRRGRVHVPLSVRFLGFYFSFLRGHILLFAGFVCLLSRGPRLQSPGLSQHHGTAQTGPSGVSVHIPTARVSVLRCRVPQPRKRE